MILRTEVRGDFNIHGTKYFQDAVFHQKSEIYDVVSLLYLWLVGQKTRPLHEILTQLFITEKSFLGVLNITFFYFTFRLSGSGKELQFGGRARYSKSPELIETTFSMSTIAEEDQQELSSKSGAAIDAQKKPYTRSAL